MALVAYDYDSGSENEAEEDDNSPATVIIPPKPEKPHQEQTSSLISQLSHLPKTKEPNPATKTSEDDKLEDFIPKYQAPKEKPPPQKVKITIPSLSQFKDDDDDEPLHKKTKTAPKGSGLLSVLPPVKGSPLSTKSFVPNVLKNKLPATEKSKTSSLVPHSVRLKAEKAKKAALRKNFKQSSSSDLESDDEDIPIPETFDEAMWQKVCGRPKQKETVQVEETASEIAEVIDIAPEPAQPYDGLDNEAFKELVGKSKRPMNIKLIDINEDEVITDKDLWLTKSLTDPDQAPKAVIDNPVDPTRKKKHHITYLAEQAKANAQELESQWSSSKHNRQQTRAKYGF